MSVKQSANGADALFGGLLDEPGALLTDGRDFAVGRTLPKTKTLSALTAPTANVGGDPGLITGVVQYMLVQHWLSADGFRHPSAWTADVTMSLSQGVVSDIPTDADLQFTDIYRRHQLDDGSYTVGYIVGRIWNTDTSFTDNLPTDSLLIRYDQPPPAVSEVGSNYGLLFEAADSIDFNPQHGRITNAELSSGEGEPASTPGPVKVSLTIKQAIRSAWDVPIAESLFGLCTMKGVEGGVEKATPSVAFDEPTRIFDFDSASSRFDPRTFSALWYPGGDVRPEWGLGFCGQEMEIAIDEGKLVMDSAKFIGVGYTVIAVGTHESGAGTYHTTGRMPVACGVMDDTSRALDDIWVKVTTAPSAGYFEVKVKLGSGSTYDGDPIRFYYSTGSDKKLKKGGSNLSDRVELFDENGIAIGFDSGENRLPLTLHFPGDVTGLAVNDVFKLKYQELIPGIGDGGARFSGKPPVRFPAPRYTQAHATLKKNGTPIVAVSAKLKLTANHDDFTSLGALAMFAEDIELSGKLKAEGEIKRRYKDKTWQNSLRRSDTFSLVMDLLGERIWVSPGVLSAYRRQYRVTLNECEVVDTTEPTSNDKVTMQTVKFRARQPVDGVTSFLNLRLVGDKHWALPS